MGKAPAVENVVQTTVRINASLFEKVQIARITRKSSMTKAIDQGLRWWLGTTPIEPPFLDGLNETQKELVMRYATLLRTGNAPRHTELIKGMLGLAERAQE